MGEINIIQYIILFIITSIIGMGSILDEWQTHRPLVACTLVGLVLGDMTAGILVGGALELLALGWSNIGAAIAPDTALASVISTILVVVAHQSQAISIGLAIPIATAGQILVIIIRSVVVGFQHGADKAAQTGEWKWISINHYISLFLYSLRISIPAIIVAATAGTSVVQDLLNAIPEVIVKGLGIAGGFIVLVGYAMIMNMMKARHLMPFFFIGFVVAAFTSFNLVGMGVLGVCIAILYISIHPKYNMPKVAATAESTGGSADLADNRLD